MMAYTVLHAKDQKKEGQRDSEKVVRGSIDVSFLAFHGLLLLDEGRRASSTMPDQRKRR
jgi:hypothetical protein